MLASIHGEVVNLTCYWISFTREEAERLAAKFRKVTIADVIESMEVCVVPFYMQDKKVSTVYKLKVKLFPSELYPPYSDITLEDCEETLEGRFIRGLEDSIQNHMVMLSKIRGIKAVTNSKDENSIKETDEESSVADSHLAGEEGEEDEEVGGDDDHTADDLGVDGQKRKRQAKDEMDYDDGMETEVPIIEDENNDRELAAGFESEIDQVEEDGDYSLGEQNEMREIEGQIYDGEDEAPESTSKLDATSEPNSSKNHGKRWKDRIVLSRKKSDRRISTAMNGLVFEVLFDFSDEPHVLLAQIAEKAAKKVYVKRSENIDRCSVIYKKKEEDGLEVPESLQTAGVNFSVFWDLEEYLDVKNIVSNDIFSMLRTYGVEAARATIEGEVKRVFKAYGIGVDIRHLTLIADFMTAAGGYRPMNRFGMAENNVSPFSKISYETATKFMVEAALHGEVETLESPSARVSLGLPVKLQHKFDGCIYHPFGRKVWPGAILSKVTGQ
ncbi:hypothetical protein ACLOJK_028795 [Asimina triloba]